MIGMPSALLSKYAEYAMGVYYENRLKAVAQEDITQLSQTFKVLQLTVVSVKSWRDKIPDLTTGEF